MITTGPGDYPDTQPERILRLSVTRNANPRGPNQGRKLLGHLPRSDLPLRRLQTPGPPGPQPWRRALGGGSELRSDAAASLAAVAAC